LIEVPAGLKLQNYLEGVPYSVLGEVTAESRLAFTVGGEVVWQDFISSLAEVWSKPFREVVG
jgi:hypothetical protein